MNGSLPEQIRLRIPTPEGPYGAETLWAKRMLGTEDEAVIANTPFFLDDPALNFGDLVRVSPSEEEGFWQVEEIIAPSGHRRLCVLLGDPTLSGQDLVELLEERFSWLVVEGATDATGERSALLWISVPADCSAEEVEAEIADWLAMQEADPSCCGYEGPHESHAGPFVTAQGWSL